jgi:hypothetical protein
MKWYDRFYLVACFILSMDVTVCISARGNPAERGPSYVPPLFLDSVRIQAGSEDLKAGDNYSAPCVVDWNGDGRKDLIVGSDRVGGVYFYANEGSDDEPIFSAGIRMRADGSRISVPGCGDGG